jgi:hypothetical protein
MILDEHGEAALAGHLLVRLGTGGVLRIGGLLDKQAPSVARAGGR